NRQKGHRHCTQPVVGGHDCLGVDQPLATAKPRRRYQSRRWRPGLASHTTRRRIAPPSPTANTLPGPLPQTPYRLSAGLKGLADRAEPLNCRIVPDWPTASTSPGPPDQTLCSPRVVPEAMVVQTEPFKRRIVPPPPTTNASPAPPAQTPYRCCN